MEAGHIGLNVSNLARSKRFYQEALGFDLMGESKDVKRQYAFLGKDQKLILTLWEQSEGNFATKLPGLHHLSFRVEDVQQVREAEQRLRNLNVHFHYDGLVPHGEGSVSGGIFFEDPDGIRLEIFTTSGVEGQHAPVKDAPSCGFF
jgi:lactoylglutathione lyase